MGGQYSLKMENSLKGVKSMNKQPTTCHAGLDPASSRKLLWAPDQVRGDKHENLSKYCLSLIRVNPCNPWLPFLNKRTHFQNYQKHRKPFFEKDFCLLPIAKCLSKRTHSNPFLVFRCFQMQHLL
jgi:hypothetical protein